jgi:hypothetical protein
MDSTSVAAWATVVLAIVGFAAFWVTWRALSVARDDAKQARYGRIDERAPRVIARNSTSPALPAARSPGSITSVWYPMQTDERLDMPGHADWKIDIEAYVELFNEGSSTAFVQLPSGAIPVITGGIRPDELDPLLTPWALGHRISLTIGPQESRWFLLHRGRPLSEWMRLYELYGGSIHSFDGGDADVPGWRFVFDVSDQFADGMHDELTVDVLVLPVHPALSQHLETGDI